MEYFYTFLLVAVVAILLIGLVQSRSASVRTFYNRNYALGAPSIVENPIDPNNPIDPTKEFFTTDSPESSTDSSQAAGQSINYRWGMPTDSDAANGKKDCVIPSKCPGVGPCRESQGINQATCDSCDILKHKDIKYFTLKSSVPACPDMSQYVKKSEVPAMPDMKDYIKKSEIPACAKCADLNDYIHKSAIPSNPECPKCPVCPVCPVCPETYDRVEQDPRFARAFANADIRKHPDISKYISKAEAQAAMQQALELQAKDLLKNLRCPEGKEKKEDKKDKQMHIEVPNIISNLERQRQDFGRRITNQVMEKKPETDYDFVFSRPAVASGEGLLSKISGGFGNIMENLFSREKYLADMNKREEELNRRALQNIPMPAGNTSQKNNGLKKMELPVVSDMKIWTDSVLPSTKCDA